MKVLGVKQFHQMKFKSLGFEGKWRESFGNVPSCFSAIFYGPSGSGKTELCIQFARYLTGFDRVAWFSYEQGHASDLQMATQRNKMEDCGFLVIDPVENRKLSFFEELDAYLGKRGSPKYIFIDSIDYTGFTIEQYKYLKEKYQKKKGMIFISHCTPGGKTPKTAVGKAIEYDVRIKVYVKQFIAEINSRYGGMKDFIINEEKARERNPLYFEKKALNQSAPPKKRGRKPKPKPEDDDTND